MNQPRRPFHFPLPIVSLFIMPRLPESFFTNQDMMVQQPLGQHSSRAPSWGPSRHQPGIGSHQAEALHPNKAYMNYPERSQEIVPLVPIQAWPPGWMPTITQELKRYGELRHEIYVGWLTTTQPSGCGRNRIAAGIVLGGLGGGVPTRWTSLHMRSPLWDRKVN